MPDNELESILIKQHNGKANYIKKKEKPKRVAKEVGVVTKRVILSICTAIVLIVSGLLGAVLIVEFGPSEKARDLFVVTVMETSAAKFLATSFLGQEKVDEILAANVVKVSENITDANLVVINNNSSGKESSADKENINQKAIIPGTDDQEVDPDGDGIDIVDIKGGSFKGKMMIVYDPTRLFVGVSGNFGEGQRGRTITDIYNSYDNVVAGINGGGWNDKDGHGMGGEPSGIVMSQGEILWGTPMSNYWECCGITKEGKLIVGTFSVQQAVDMEITDAVKYGPCLIVNNEPTEALGTGGGLNPRTAIGQRADGAMLLLAIDGRQSNSIGASLTDVQDIMLKFEAVNAYNLDGGSSTSMIYNGEQINSNASLVGLREMCTTFLVRGKDND